MPAESAPTSQHKSLESQRKTFQQRLDGILYKPLTIENIEIFADQTLNEAIKLTEDVLREYRSNPNIKASPTTLANQEQEDEAFAILGLENINEILEQINKVKQQIDFLKKYLEENIQSTDTIITPPQERQIPNIAAGDESFEKKKMFPRLLTLMYIIEHDFDIVPTPKTIPVKEGIVTPNMMRKTPYMRVEIPELNRAVYICDEAENASYVFDTEKITQANLTLEEIDIDDKGDKNSLIAYHPGIGIRIIQSPNWRTRVADALGKEIPKVLSAIPLQHERQERSEFERPKWLPFDEFKVEIISLYPGEGSVVNWYDMEQKRHPNWPAAPYIIYKHQGWIGFPELVGKENPKKKKWPAFATFQAEIRALYPGQGDMKAWYREERKNHSDWPSDPWDTYKDKGWIGFPEIIGRKNFMEKDYLDFEHFQAEVRGLYRGQSNIEAWYYEEIKRHPNWPYKPYKIYEGKGWVGLPELVGVVNYKKREFLSFEDFQNELRNLYPGKIDATDWYNQERKKHSNWPASPRKTYGDKGWQGFPKLLGVDNRGNKKK